MTCLVAELALPVAGADMDDPTIPVEFGLHVLILCPPPDRGLSVAAPAVGDMTKSAVATRCMCACLGALGLAPAVCDMGDPAAPKLCLCESRAGKGLLTGPSACDIGDPAAPKLCLCERFPPETGLSILDSDATPETGLSILDSDATTGSTGPHRCRLNDSRAGKGLPSVPAACDEFIGDPSAPGMCLYVLVCPHDLGLSEPAVDVGESAAVLLLCMYACRDDLGLSVPSADNAAAMLCVCVNLDVLGLSVSVPAGDTGDSDDVPKNKCLYACFEVLGLSAPAADTGDSDDAPRNKCLYACLDVLGLSVPAADTSESIVE